MSKLNFPDLIGRTIAKIYIIRPEQAMSLGWEIGGYNGPFQLAFELDDGRVIVASQDEEGNGPGAFFVIDKEKDSEGFHGIQTLYIA